jgi:glycosyltransferase involved in cell wall biosynthesis
MSQPNMNVVLAGVVPPPVHGASLATRALFDADLQPIVKNLLEIRSSKNLQEVGRASLGKIFGLVGLVARCWQLKFRSKAQVLYYTPGSAAFVPFVRDVIFLGCCRWLFHRTVLHYHSGGLNDYLARSYWRRILGKWTYGRGAWALTLSQNVEVPGLDYGAANVFEVPNGLNIDATSGDKEPSDFLRILFLGNLYEDKGVFDLLEACQRIALTSAAKIRLQFVGKWPDEATNRKFYQLIEKTKSLENLQIPEPCALYGDEKWHAYAQSDLFIFPSYYRSENFPLVLLEAMASGLPIISTKWRGIPSIVSHGVTGFLHDVGDIEKLKSLIQVFLDSPEILTKMGLAAKKLYLEKFTFENHRDLVVDILCQACRKHHSI